MDKKKYVSPTLNVVLLNTCKMLCGSITESTSGASQTENGIAGARSFDGWLDDEE